MPTKAKVPRAEDVAEGQPKSLDKVVNQDLTLEKVTFTNSENFGQQAHLFVEDVTGGKIELITFSMVVIDQLKGIADKLPVIITPKFSGTYYTIY